ncbi:HNH endonuclease [Stenotrophomonas phage BUCTxx99]|nr:HNH endonuclease [Stenotrophomonas phage BUCTxx99]
MPKKDKNEYMREYMLRRYHERMTLARNHLGGKCANCGALDDLELDHIDPTTKSFTIGNMWSVNKESFWAEVAKCQLLCVKCHSEKTLVDLKRKSAKLEHGTLSSFKYCKCPDCKKAKADYMREYMRKRRA